MDLLDPEEEARLLLEVVDPRYAGMLLALHETITATLGLNPAAFRLDDAAVRRILVEAGHRVVRITETTRIALAETVQQGQALGLSDWEIANGSAAHGYPGIEGLFTETWKSRAQTIARTELAHAQNAAAADRFRASGVVEALRIVDGDDDAPCAARNGQVVPVTQTPALLHPNCTLSVVPILREGV